MNAALLSAHVVVAILAVGPIAVAASMFPRYARALSANPADDGVLPAARLLNRICQTYAVLAVAVPLLGIATAVGMGVLTDAWVLISLALTIVAAAVLALSILPGQRAALTGAAGNAARLAMLTGIFNVLWVVITVLMIVRPGSTTGA